MMHKSFHDVFGFEPLAQADAPGRVNLLGEHTDYNDGFVLPTAIAQRTRVTMGLASGADFNLYAAELGEAERFRLGRPPISHFASYVYGCIALLQKEGAVIPPLDIHVESDVPMGVGLSSSAALEVATLRTLRALTGFAIDDVRIAQLAQLAEIQYAHVNCGIMDQMASSLADEAHMLFIDTRSLECKLLPLPSDAEILVVDSGVARSLAESGYNDRRGECEEAARRLRVRALRDIEDPAAAEKLPEPLRRRARHVISENARVLAAVAEKRPEAFGRMMNASHLSLRDDFEVSIPALDRLVDLLQRRPEVYGARLTGAGFGGACVALCRAGEAKCVGEAVLRDYNGAEATGTKGSVLVPR